MSKVNIANLTKRIDFKNWNIITDLWLNYIPLLNFPINNDEDFSYIDNELSKLFDNAKEEESRKTEKNHYFTLKGLHSKVFIDAIVLFYKGLNALKSAQSDQKSGYKTWSILNYYQSAFFFVKSFLFLNGIWIHKTSSSKNVVIDLFPSFQSKKGNEADRYRDEGFFNLLISHVLDHREVWSIFLRALNISSALPIDSKIIYIFKQINPEDFAKQRNSLIYHNHKWLFEDLKTELFDSDFGKIKLKSESINDDDCFTLSLSFFLLDSLNKMIYALKCKSIYLESEYLIIEKALRSENNDIFHKFIDINL